MSEPLVVSSDEFMGLPIVVIEEWPEDRVAIVSRRLAEEIKGALAYARELAERNR